MCWRALWELTRDAELPAREYLRTVLEHVGAETEPGVAQRLLGQAATAVSTYGDPSNRDAASTRLATGALELLSGAEPGSDLQLAYGRSFISAATSEEQLATARGLLDGSVTYADLRVDIELRWLIVRALAAAGVGDGLAEAELERDPTDRGRRHASAARASRPTPEAKAEAWETIVADETQYLATLEAIMAGFQRPDQEAVLEPYAERYFEVLPEIWERRDLTVALAFGEAMYCTRGRWSGGGSSTGPTPSSSGRTSRTRRGGSCSRGATTSCAPCGREQGTRPARSGGAPLIPGRDPVLD